MSFNLATVLREWTKTSPDKPLLHFGDATWTYEQVDQLSGQVAEGLRRLGPAPGGTVALQLPNVPEFVIAYFGVLKAGLVLVPLNPLLKAPEIAYHLTNSDAEVLITAADVADEALKGTAGIQGMTVFVVPTATAGADVPEGARPFAELIGPPLDEAFDPWSADDIEPTAADDTAVLLYTSGTTGRPKGAELSHFQMFMACTVGGETFQYTRDDVSLVVLPLFHVFGLSSTFNVAVRYGGSAVLVPRFDAQVVLDEMERHRCTVFCGVPTMYIALLHADQRGRDLSALRRGVSGGASIPGEVIRGFEEKYPGVVVLEGYGLSETAALATFNASGQRRRVRSIGLPMWGVELRIVDDEDRPLPPGEDQIGEIVLRGHNVFKGYHKNEQATAEAVRGGWFHTGDVAYRDDDGFVFIVDRKKDLIIRGGFNVYPREIEEVLHEHAEVVEASAVGRPDTRLGEEVVAFVVLRPGAAATPEDLVGHCKERLAAYKYPRRVVVLDTLPRGGSGKVLKSELRER
jgi:long-chain acyl-CoA synthetase